MARTLVIRDDQEWERSFTGEDLVGRRFGRYVVQSYAGRNTHKKPRWSCICDCGTEKVVDGAPLRQGIVVSCGCYRKEQALKAVVKHGLYDHPLYKVWTGMKGRCYGNTPERVSKHYKDKGITVCDEWRDDFMAFYRWAMKKGYKTGLSVDRRNGNLGYSPQNCRLATPLIQNRNTSRNVYFLVNGESLTLRECAEKYSKASYATVFTRLRTLGWSLQDALATPVSAGCRNLNAK